MAEAASDPRETLDHPRLAQQLIGHHAAQAQILQRISSGKLHHAWILAGPSGIGKATLAYKFAGVMLEQARGEGLPEQGLHIASNSQTGHWLAARAHPDLFVLERQWDSKTKKLKSELLVDDARKLSDFFGKTAGSGGWRVAIIDAADDMNLGSANALLKLIEEPPPDSLLLLITHQPGRLLRTIQSRCTRLDLHPLTEAETTTVLHGLDSLSGEDPQAMTRAIQLSQGRPGQALSYLHAEGAKAFAAFQHMPNLSPQALVEFATRFNGRQMTGDDFDIFFNLLDEWLVAQAKAHLGQPQANRLAEAADKIGHSIRQTNALNLDRRQAVIHAMTLINDAMKPA